MRTALSNWRISTSTSIPYCTFELFNNSKSSAHCGISALRWDGLQVARRAAKQKPTGLYRPAKGIGRVAEMIHKVCRIVAKYRASECPCLVGLVWTRPSAIKWLSTAWNHLGAGGTRLRPVQRLISRAYLRRATSVEGMQMTHSVMSDTVRFTM